MQKGKKAREGRGRFAIMTEDDVPIMIKKKGNKNKKTGSEEMN